MKLMSPYGRGAFKLARAAKGSCFLQESTTLLAPFVKKWPSEYGYAQIYLMNLYEQAKHK